MSSNNCIRILRIVSVMNRGGIETQIMNMYRKLDKSKFQFDFLVTRDEDGIFDQEIKELGGRIYKVSSVREVGLVAFTKSINDFFKIHKEYEIVHSHMNTWSGLFLGIAKRNKVKVRIAQSHSAQQGYKGKKVKEKIEVFFKQVMKKFIKHNATHFWAVGQEAGEWLYGKKIASSRMKILPNAKELELYKFDYNIKKKIRKELNIPMNSYIIGHVGSFSPVKNHMFLIDIFRLSLNKYNNVHLCLVGDGPLRNNIENKVLKHKLTDKVHLLGLRNDVNELMSAFDVLVLPSTFEGMPNVIIEAQAAGLPCIVSDKITQEIDMEMGLISYLPLQDNYELWAKKILEKCSFERGKDLEKIRVRGYDLKNVVYELELFYTSVT